MPIFAAISAFLARFAGPAFLSVLLLRALVVLGVSTVTYFGLTSLMGTVVSHMNSELGSLSESMAAIIHLSSADKGISIVLSAVSARMVLAGLTGAGIIKRMVFSGPG